MTTTELFLAGLVIVQAIAWLITDYSRFEDGETNE